jgi:cbb3-type cytochrome oxidase subunit 3
MEEQVLINFNLTAFLLVLVYVFRKGRKKRKEREKNLQRTFL